MDFSAKHEEFERLKRKVELLERELGDIAAEESWQPTSYYWAYHVTSGFLLGVMGAAAALLFNVVLAPIAGKHPLELIRVFLTFPLGADALSLADAANNVPTVRDGMILTFGCCLYLATGMLIGMPFHVALTRLVPNGTARNRLLIATGLSLAIWLIGFYGILSWLQPRLFGGDWITSGKYLPWWVAAATHLAFGWTMALLAPMAKFLPYPAPVETEDELRSPAEDGPIQPGG
ncbi:MAG: hypothetical protein FD138_609 [Planctomycetota bacterium]|nr:MAG: hypothetical protein FD138_609 [Planctomycetota bacterium]